MHDGVEQENSMHASSSYGEGVFELIQEIFNVHVEESDDGRPVTRSRREMSRKNRLEVS